EHRHPRLRRTPGRTPRLRPQRRPGRARPRRRRGAAHRSRRTPGPRAGGGDPGPPAHLRADRPGHVHRPRRSRPHDRHR
ncbi:MAG: Mg/Co/Ni transporter MgtE, CBS domain-containing, partial [uncultured Blastococcus sp.]